MMRGTSLVLLLLFYRDVCGALSFLAPAAGGSSTSVAEDEAVDATLYTVVANGDTPVYVIESQSPGSPTFTGENSGGDFLLKNPGLDYETASSYTFTFKVTDNLGAELVSDTFTLTVTDVNDVAPVFSNTPYSATVQDDAATGTTIIQVTATDGDGTSPNNDINSYAIQGGNSAGNFDVTSQGEVTVAGGATLTTGDTFTLTVRATDGGTSALFTDVTVGITVTSADPCVPNPCQNSGTCSQQASSAVCTCIGKWVGSTCSDGCSYAQLNARLNSCVQQSVTGTTTEFTLLLLSAAEAATFCSSVATINTCVTNVVSSCSGFQEVTEFLTDSGSDLTAAYNSLCDTYTSSSGAAPFSCVSSSISVATVTAAMTTFNTDVDTDTTPSLSETCTHATDLVNTLYSDFDSACPAATAAESRSRWIAVVTDPGKCSGEGSQLYASAWLSSLAAVLVIIIESRL